MSRCIEVTSRCIDMTSHCINITLIYNWTSRQYICTSHWYMYILASDTNLDVVLVHLASDTNLDVVLVHLDVTSIHVHPGCHVGSPHFCYKQHATCRYNICTGASWKNWTLHQYYWMSCRYSWVSCQYICMTQWYPVHLDVTLEILDFVLFHRLETSFHRFIDVL